ncbi:MAG: efflux RND transporter periplasmic adaptor subunit [Vitreoscilla sp.]|nr:efflux RND transporter periplasmic adaptor subunit [Vitreoscilla sp.]
MSKLHVTVAVVGLALASGVAWWVQRKGDSGAASVLATPGTAAASRAPGAAGGGVNAGPALVEAGRVTAMRLEDDATAVGTLRPRQGVMLRPEVSGRIKTLTFADGKSVRRGQVLVQLDDSLQVAQVQQAEAQALIARSNLARSRELLGQGFVSQSVVDQNAANLQVAEAQVALAKAQAGRMRIVAPFDGVAGIRAVSVGDYVKDGADLVSIDDTSTLWVDFRLPERYAARLHTGQTVEVTLDAMPGVPFKAQVDALDSQVDANGRALLVRARLANDKGLLRPGMFARARVLFAAREGALVVPEEALVPQGGKQYLIVLVPGEAGTGPVSRRIEARTGARMNGKVEILEGVKAGDQVVTAGQARLLRTDGQVVKVVDIGQPPAASGPARGKPAAASTAGA